MTSTTKNITQNPILSNQNFINKGYRKSNFFINKFSDLQIVNPYEEAKLSEVSKSEEHSDSQSSNDDIYERKTSKSPLQYMSSSPTQKLQNYTISKEEQINSPNLSVIVS